MASNDEWPPVKSAGKTLNGNKSLRKSKNNQHNQKQVILEMFKDTLDQEVIISVGETYNWEYDQTIDKLIDLTSSSSLSLSSTMKNDFERDSEYLNMNFEELKLQYERFSQYENLKKAQNESEVVSNFQFDDSNNWNDNSIQENRNSINKPESIVDKSLEPKKLIETSTDFLVKKESKSWLIASSAVETSESLRKKSAESKSLMSTDSQELSKQVLFTEAEECLSKKTLLESQILGSSSDPKYLAEISATLSSKSEETANVRSASSGTYFSLKTPSKMIETVTPITAPKLTEKSLKSSELCGLKVHYRSSALDSSDDDDADVVIEEELNNYISSNLSTQFMSSAVQSSAKKLIQASPKRVVNASKSPKKSLEDERLERICERIRKGEKMMIILRGLPGSGKSTLARKIVRNGLKMNADNFSRFIFSTDDYFFDKYKRIYRYDITKLSDAHASNQLRVREAMDANKNPVIVDNTNLEVWEMRSYAIMAVERRYQVELVDTNSKWADNPAELAKRNIHGVPKEKIKMMKEKYERRGMTGDQLLKFYSLKQSSDSSQKSVDLLSTIANLPAKRANSAGESANFSSVNEVTESLTLENEVPNSLMSLSDLANPSSTVEILGNLKPENVSENKCPSLSTIKPIHTSTETANLQSEQVGKLSSPIVSPSKLTNLPSSSANSSLAFTNLPSKKIVKSPKSSTNSSPLLQVLHISSILNQKTIDSTKDVNSVIVPSVDPSKQLLNQNQNGIDSKIETDEVDMHSIPLGAIGSERKNSIVQLLDVEFINPDDENVSNESKKINNDGKWCLKTNKINLNDHYGDDPRDNNSLLHDISTCEGFTRMMENTIRRNDEFSEGPSAEPAFLSKNTNSKSNIFENKILITEADAKFTNFDNVTPEEMFETKISNNQKLEKDLASDQVLKICESNNSLKLARKNDDNDDLVDQLVKSIDENRSTVDLEEKLMEKVDCPLQITDKNDKTMISNDKSKDIFDFEEKTVKETDMLIVGDDKNPPINNNQSVIIHDEITIINVDKLAISNMKSNSSEIGNINVDEPSMTNSDTPTKVEQSIIKPEKLTIINQNLSINIDESAINNIDSFKKNDKEPLKKNKKSVISNVQSPNRNKKLASREPLIDPELLLTTEITWKSSPFPVDDLKPVEFVVEKKIVSTTESETNTSYYDFNVAYVGGVSDPAYCIIDAFNRSINENLVSQQNPNQQLSGVLKLDKSSMTGEDDHQEIENPDNLEKVGELMELFPHVPKDYLTEIYEKCQRNFNWAVEVLLDGVPNDEDTSNENSTKSESESADQVSTKNNLTIIDDDLSKIIDTERLMSPDQLKLIDEAEDSLLNDKSKTPVSQAENLDFDENQNFSDPNLKNDIDTIDSIEKIPEPDEMIELDVGFQLIRSLEEKFGNSAAIPDGFFPKIQIKKSMAEELYALWIESMYHQLNARHEHLNEMIARDAEFAKSLEKQFESEIESSVTKDEPNIDECVEKNKDRTKIDDVFSRDLNSIPPSLATYESSWSAESPKWVQNKAKPIESMNSARPKFSEVISNEFTGNRLANQMLYESLPDIDPQLLNEILISEGGNVEKAFQVCKNRFFGCEIVKKVMTPTKENIVNIPKEKSRSGTPIIVVKPAINNNNNYCDPMLNFEKLKMEADRQFSLKVENFNKAADAYRRGYPQVAAYYSQVSRLQSENIEKAQTDAAKALVQAQRLGENDDILDLHYLSVHQALEALDQFLQDKLKDLEKKAKKLLIVYIITGRGARSTNSKSKIKPAVEKQLNIWNIRFSEANPGCLKVILHRKNILD